MVLAGMQHLYVLKLNLEMHYFIIPLFVSILFAFIFSSIKKQKDEVRIARLRLKLDQMEKLSNIGLYASTLAHDMNNYLQGLNFSVESLKEIPGTKDKVDLSLSLIDECKKLIDKLLNFTSEKEEVSDVVFLNFKADLEGILKSQKGPRFNLIINSNIEDGKIIQNRNHLLRMIVNLTINSIHALEGKNNGEIEISIIENNQLLIIEVIDNGIGMSESIQENIFESYFSTKNENGTGLGLHIVKKLVKEVKGNITLKSKKGKGTTFKIEIPIRA